MWLGTHGKSTTILVVGRRDLITSQTISQCIIFGPKTCFICQNAFKIVEENKNTLNRVIIKYKYVFSSTKR
jgi:hypothetical protein